MGREVCFCCLADNSEGRPVMEEGRSEVRTRKESEAYLDVIILLCSLGVGGSKMGHLSDIIGRREGETGGEEE